MVNTGYVLANSFTIYSVYKLKLYCKRMSCLFPWYFQSVTISFVTLLFLSPCNKHKLAPYIFCNVYKQNMTINSVRNLKLYCKWKLVCLLTIPFIIDYSMLSMQTFEKRGPKESPNNRYKWRRDIRRLYMIYIRRIYSIWYI